MSPPLPRVNTFMNIKNNSSADIDFISKVFIISECVVGINRTSLISPRKQFFPVLTTGLISCGYVVLFYYSYNQYDILLLHFFYCTDFVEFLLCSTLCYALHRKLFYFYVELNKFDKETGFQKKEAINIKYCIANVIQIFIVIGFVSTFHLQAPGQSFYVIWLWVLAKTFHCLEIHFYAHLFTLIIPRLKCIYRYMTLSYPTTYNKHDDEQDGKKNVGKSLQIDIKKIMDFYNRITISFEYLNESLRWQMLILFMSTFCVVLVFTFIMVKTLIYVDATILQIVNQITICLVELVPLIAPCVYAEGICSEVRQLKEYLTTRIFDNTFDKSNRSSARAFLMLIEKRNLTFSLFDMFFIDISLPMKFTALWLTYLIMILQFDKVVNALPT